MLLLHRRRALAGGTAAAAWAKRVADAEGRWWFLVAQLVSEALLPLPHRPASPTAASKGADMAGGDGLRGWVAAHRTTTIPKGANDCAADTALRG